MADKKADAMFVPSDQMHLVMGANLPGMYMRGAGKNRGYGYGKGHEKRIRKIDHEGMVGMMIVPNEVGSEEYLPRDYVWKPFAGQEGLFLGTRKDGDE